MIYPLDMAIRPRDRDRALQGALHRLADESEPKIRDVILAAVEATRDDLSIRGITAALRSADPEAALDEVLVLSLSRRLTELTGEYLGLYLRGGTTLAEALAEGYAGEAIEVRFDTLNPRVLEAARTNALTLVTALEDESRDAVRAILTTGLQNGRHPFDMAEELKDVVGLDERRARALANFRRGLEQRERQAALNRDLSPRLAQQVQVALRDEHLDADRINDLVERYRERLVAQRAEMIARTESIRALSDGQHEAMRQAAADGHVNGNTLRRYWLVTPDEITCPICRGIVASNPNGVGLEEPFVSSVGPVMNPPAPHPGCRCSIFYRTEPANSLLEVLNPAPRVVTDSQGRARFETLAESYARRPVRGLRRGIRGRFRPRSR